MIFGWGHTITRVFGPTFERLCSHCNNEKYWILSRITTWFTLFFIPVFPYKNVYFLACPICQYGLELDNEQIAKIRPLAETNQMLVDGKITEAEYQTKILSLNGETSSEPIYAEAVSLPVQSAELKFCGECGKETIKDMKFCSNCGTPAAQI